MGDRVGSDKGPDGAVSTAILNFGFTTLAADQQPAASDKVEYLMSASANDGPQQVTQSAYWEAPHHSQAPSNDDRRQPYYPGIRGPHREEEYAYDEQPRRVAQQNWHDGGMVGRDNGRSGRDRDSGDRDREPGNRYSEQQRLDRAQPGGPPQPAQQPHQQDFAIHQAFVSEPNMDRRRVELRVGPDPENPLAPYLLGEANGKPDTPTSKQELSIVRDELQDAYLIPDVLPDTFAPEFPVAIRFNGERVLLGELLSVQQTQSEPTIEFDAAPGQYFAIAIVDPDAPSVSRHGYRSYRHYLLGNLEPRSFDILTPFEPPSPSAGPAHRYAVVVFRQHGHIEFNRDDVPDSRVRFDAVKWGRELNMKLVASTFFMVKDSRTTKVRH